MSTQNRGCLGFLFSLFGAAYAGPANLPYQTCPSLLTPTELTFYRVLRLAVDNSYAICPKVRLIDIFNVVPETQAAKNRIIAKHVDFLLCDPATLRPVAGIELDDRSHQRADRQASDRLKDQVFDSCGLPLIRFEVNPPYDPRMIRTRLHQEMGARITYEVARPTSRKNDPVTPTPIVGHRK